MSIANLTDFKLPLIDAIEGDFQNIHTRTINANNTYDTTLFVGEQVITTNVQIGRLGGNPITMPSGILTTSVERGGLMGAGALTIGNLASTTSIAIGDVAKNTILLGNVVLPSSGINPLIINDSYDQIVGNAGFSGALVVAAGAAQVIARRIGHMTEVSIKNFFTRAIPDSNALNSVDPITLTFALPVGLRPYIDYTFAAGIFLNGNQLIGQCKIDINGVISFGAIDTFHYTGGQSAGIMDCSISYLTN